MSTCGSVPGVADEHDLSGVVSMVRGGNVITNGCAAADDVIGTRASCPQ
ncbi:hypothetical protein ACFXPA_41505 [Amycolatopsis sp. NPDC059090]